MLIHQRIQVQRPPCHSSTQSLAVHRPWKIKKIYIRLVHLSIDIISAFFDVGVCGTVVFTINFVITAFKMCFWAKLIGKGIVEVLRPKIACLHFMVICRLNLFANLIAVDSRHIFYCHKMAINTLVVNFSIKVKVPKSCIIQYRMV